MPDLPTRLPRLMAFAASAAFAVLLLAGSGQADASYYQPSYRSYRDYPAYNGYGYGTYRHGHGEICELQRLFPETNWPPSKGRHILT